MNIHPRHNPIAKIVFAPIISLYDYLCIKCPDKMIRLRFWFTFNRKMHLKHPQDLGEKIFWLLLNTDTSLWTKLSDKYAVREFVQQRVGDKYLIPLLQKWDHAEDVNFDNLPDQFILKSTTGSGSNIVVNDKSTIHINEIKATLATWLKDNAFGYEKHYRTIPKAILAEQLLPIPKGQVSLRDYKVWCFNGKPYYIWVCSNRVVNEYGTTTYVMTYDTNWNPMPEASVFNDSYREDKPMPAPKCLDELLSVASKLSQGFPQVRVDLYIVDDKIFFGEMTFTSNGGLMDFYTQEFLLHCGQLIQLPEK